MDAFLSYASSDAKIAQKLLEELAALGVRAVNWEDRKLDPGTDWRQALEDAISSTPVSLVLVGKNANPGPWQQIEWRLMLEEAWRTGKRLIPVLLPGAVLPKFVGSANRDFQVVQIHDPRDLAEAAQVIARTIRGQEPSDRVRRGDSIASVFSVHADLEELKNRLAENKQALGE